jgi:hypothetical protein
MTVMVDFGDKLLCISLAVEELHIPITTFMIAVIFAKKFVNKFRGLIKVKRPTRVKAPDRMIF